MSLRGWLKRLERSAEEEMIVIPQQDGPPARFPAEAAKEALANMMDRLGAGEDAPLEHPLLVAVRNSSGPEWSQSLFAVEDPDEWIQPVEDLSE